MSDALKDWKLLRTKVDTADDPDYAALYLHPNSATYTVGGVTANGNYTITIAGVANTFDRQAAETDAQIATELYDLIVADMASGGSLYDYVESITDDGAGVLTITYKVTRERFVVSTSAPGGASITAAPADTFPIVAGLPYYRGALGQMSVIELAFVAVDATDGNVLPDDNAMTMTVQIIETVKRATTQARAALGVGITSTAALAAASIRNKVRVELNGAIHVGLRLSTLANTPTSFAELEVWYREAYA